MQPLVSIVIPTYNRADLVVEAVESCLLQTYSNLEVIIIDDGSKDSTEGVVSRRQATDWAAAKVRYVRQDNDGSCSARNHGLSLATGKYLQFLDSDDILLPEKIERQVVELERFDCAEVDFCYCLGRMVDLEKASVHPIGQAWHTREELLCAMISREVHVMQTNAPLWRLDFLKGREGWRTDIGLGDDLEYYVRLVLDAKRISCIQEELFEMKVHSGERLSAERLSQKQISSILKTLSSIYAQISKSNFWGEPIITSFLGRCRAAYANVLEFGAESDLAELEVWLLPVARNHRAGSEIRLFALLRKMSGFTPTRFIFNLIMKFRR